MQQVPEDRSTHTTEPPDAPAASQPGGAGKGVPRGPTSIYSQLCMRLADSGAAA